jgi:P27 family predicted phage terminase small subunit
MGEKGKGSQEIKNLRLKSNPRVNPPGDISPESKAVFEKVVNACKPNHFSESDVPVLKLFCDAVVNASKAQAKLQTVEWVYIDEEGKEKKTIWLDILKSQQSTVAILSPKLGLCPSSRVDKAKKHGNNIIAPTESKRADLLG